jgi:hypothetical protein
MKCKQTQGSFTCGLPCPAYPPGSCLQPAESTKSTKRISLYLVKRYGGGLAVSHEMPTVSNEMPCFALQSQLSH